MQPIRFVSQNQKPGLRCATSATAYVDFDARKIQKTGLWASRALLGWLIIYKAQRNLMLRLQSLALSFGQGQIAKSR